MTHKPRGRIHLMYLMPGGGAKIDNRINLLDAGNGMTKARSMSGVAQIRDEVVGRLAGRRINIDGKNA